MSDEGAEENRALELLWGDWLPPRRGPKPALSVERIVQAGIEVADADGLPALSMSRVAKSLGSPLMSLYRYVHSKAELIDVMLDTVIGPPPNLEEIAGGWRSRLEHWAKENERVFCAHPWALSLVTMRRVIGPNEIAWLEAGLGAVSDIGLTEGEMLEVVLLTNTYARGNAQILASAAADGPETDTGWESVYAQILERDSARKRFPAVARLFDAGTLDRRVESFGLTRVLDGVQGFVENRGRKR